LPTCSAPVLFCVGTVTNMTRLILTGDASAALGLPKAGRADIAIDLEPRFIGGPLPSDAELAAMLAPRTTQGPGSHWLDYASTPARKKIGGRDLGLIELCGRCETVEAFSRSESAKPAMPMGIVARPMSKRIAISRSSAAPLGIHSA